MSDRRQKKSSNSAYHWSSEEEQNVNSSGRLNLSAQPNNPTSSRAASASGTMTAQTSARIPQAPRNDLFWSLLINANPHNAPRRYNPNAAGDAPRPGNSQTSSNTRFYNDIKKILAIKKSKMRSRPIICARRTDGSCPMMNDKVRAHRIELAKLMRRNVTNECANSPAAASHHAPQPSTSSGECRRRIYENSQPANFAMHGDVIPDLNKTYGAVTINSDTDDDTDIQLKKDERNLTTSSGHDSSQASTSIILMEEILEIEPSEVQSMEVDNRSQNEPEVVEQPGRSTDVPQPVIQEVPPVAPIAKKKDEDFGKELNASLLRLLECPVCLEWMSSSVAQCRRGHLICGGCRERLPGCPVCRTPFSSVRNRAMEEVSELLHYPCRYSCGVESKLRRRAAHEASCPRRHYGCPFATCAGIAPLAIQQLASHFHLEHASMLKHGDQHKFTLKMDVQEHFNYILLTMHDLFHASIDVDLRSWCVTLYVAYIGPKHKAKQYTYEVTVESKHGARKLVYSRLIHSDIDTASISASRRDCFLLFFDQASNFFRTKNDTTLDINVAIIKNDAEVEKDDCDV